MTDTATTPATATATVTSSALPGQVFETSATTIKPGWQTSEFYLALAAKILSGLFAFGLVGDGSTISRLAGVAGFVLTQLGYTVSRTLIKTAAMTLLFVTVIHTQSACSTGASRQSTLGYALATATAISAEMTPQNDALIQADIAGRATTQAAGDAALTKYEKARDKVFADVPIVLDAIGAAYQLNDDASLKTAEMALATLLADAITMKGAK